MNIDYDSNLGELLAKPPRKIFRYGLILILIITGVAIFLSSRIKVPQTINGIVEIRSKQSLLNLLSMNTGRIHLIVEDGDTVRKNQVLATIGNEKHPEIIEELLDRLKMDVNNLQLESMNVDQFNQYLNYLVYIDSQIFIALENYISSIIDLQNSQKLKVKQENEFRLKHLRIEQLLLEKQIIEENRKLDEELIKIIVSNYKDDSTLYFMGSSTTTEFRNSKLNYIQSMKSQDNDMIQLARLTADIHQLNHELLTEKEQISIDRKKLVRNLLKNHKNLIITCETWKRNNLLVSPEDGLIYFEEYIYNNKYVSNGEELFKIFPRPDKLEGFIKIRVEGSGEIKINDKCRISIRNYSAMKYGYVYALVSELPRVPTDDGYYIIKVVFPEGLKTTNGTDLKYLPNLIGDAEIILEKQSILSQVFRNVLSIVK